MPVECPLLASKGTFGPLIREMLRGRDSTLNQASPYEGSEYQRTLE